MQRLMLALFFVVNALFAQRIELVNHSPYPVDAWQRVTIDTPLAHPAGRVRDVRYVTAHRVGVDAFAVDVRVPLAPGEQRVVVFSDAQPEPFTLGPLPADVFLHFGGQLSVGGTFAQMVRVEPDGAAWRAELLARFGETFCARVWLRWYPDHPATAAGELVVVSSNPESPLLAETVAEDARLVFGDALVWSVGRGFGGMVLPEGESLADGQGRFLPFVACWMRHMAQPEDWGNALALAIGPNNLGVCGRGIERLLPEGRPRMPRDFNVKGWVARHWPQVLNELHTWEWSELGASRRSGDTGQQEVQTYHVGGEAMLSGGVGAERVRWLSALRLHLARPMNHLTIDGGGVEDSPGLGFTNGRPHYHPSVNSDARGKPRLANGFLIGPTQQQTHGFDGPDEQHHYMGDASAVARLVDSPAAQWVLERHAAVYLLQRTDIPGMSTSATFAAREWGCEGDMVVHLARNLTNRTLAEKVIRRWNNRVVRILAPAMVSTDIILVWHNDPRINPLGAGAQWWQESFAAESIWRASALVGPEIGKAIALRVARKVVDVAWSWNPETNAWMSQGQGPIGGGGNAQNPPSHSFDGFGMPCAVRLLRYLEPTNEKALWIWQQLTLSEAGRCRWMLP